MAKVTVELTGMTATSFELLHFKQEGYPGLILDPYRMSDLLKSMQDEQADISYFYETFFVQNTPRSCTIGRLGRDTDLVKMSGSQATELVQYLTNQFPQYV